MNVLQRIVHNVSGLLGPIPEWAPHGHDALGRNVPGHHGRYRRHGRRGHGYGHGRYGHHGHGYGHRIAYRAPVVPFGLPVPPLPAAMGWGAAPFAASPFGVSQWGSPLAGAWGGATMLGYQPGC